MVAHYVEAALRVALRTAPPRRKRRARAGKHSRTTSEKQNPARLLLETFAPDDPDALPSTS
jgi:hypothetical protein